MVTRFILLYECKIRAYTDPGTAPFSQGRRLITVTIETEKLLTLGENRQTVRIYPNID